MGNKTKRRIVGLLSLALITGQALTACSLLPVEESRPSPVVQSMERVDYALEMVTRQDIVNFKNIYCTYEQLEDESLSFGIGDKTVEKVYIDVGSQVKAGDLLAELSLGSIDDQIYELSYKIELNQMKLTQTKRLMDLDIEKQSRLFQKGYLTQDEYDLQITMIKESNAKTIQDYEDTLYIDGLLLDSYLDIREQGRIYAGIDGVVTYMKEYLEGSKVQEDEVVIEIIDNSKCAFQTETDYASYFKDGDIVEIQMRFTGGNIYETIVSHDKDNPNLVYFELPEPDFELSVGDRGSITLILEEKENVLTVSRNSIRNAEDFKYVYYVNEDGIRSMKQITIGMMTTNYVEVTSGLEHGDIIISR